MMRMNVDNAQSVVQLLEAGQANIDRLGRLRCSRHPNTSTDCADGACASTTTCAVAVYAVAI